MTWHEAIAVLRREIFSRIEAVPSALFGWTTTAQSSELGDKDAVATADGEKGQRPVRRIEPWGHRGRAPGGVRTLWIKLGSSNVVFVGIAPSARYGPNDLEEGESAQYCAVPGTEIRLDKDGKVKADGTEVNLNNGSNGVARLGDEIRITGAALAAILDTRYVQVGSPPDLGDGIGSITQASSTVKAGD